MGGKQRVLPAASRPSTTESSPSRAVFRRVLDTGLSWIGPPPSAIRDLGASIENFFWIAFVVVPIAGSILRSLLGRFLGASLTSGVTGLAAWLIFGSIAVGVIADLHDRFRDTGWFSIVGGSSAGALVAPFAAYLPTAAMAGIPTRYNHSPA